MFDFRSRSLPGNCYVLNIVVTSAKWRNISFKLLFSLIWIHSTVIVWGSFTCLQFPENQCQRTRHCKIYIFLYIWRYVVWVENKNRCCHFCWHTEYSRNRIFFKWFLHFNESIKPNLPLYQIVPLWNYLTTKYAFPEYSVYVLCQLKTIFVLFFFLKIISCQCICTSVSRGLSERVIIKNCYDLFVF